MEYLIEELLKLLSGVPKSNLKDWGYEVCKLSRRVHIRIWQIRPPHDVTRYVLELLLQAVSFVDGVEGCNLYIWNIKIRIESIEQSLIDGGMPIIPDGAEAEEEGYLIRENQRLSEMYPSACA